MSKPMTFSDYQREASKTAGDHMTLTQAGLGLWGETGEVGEMIKKLNRGDVVQDHAWNKAMAKELGDVLWYLSELAGRVGYSLQQVAVMNLEKLRRRDKMGLIKGSGSDREVEV